MTRPVFTSLLGALSGVEQAEPDWSQVSTTFARWSDHAGLRAELRDQLRALLADAGQDILARSKETTTHFAWCLRDEPTEGFSFWLHEYKPQADWLPGYADSVHNHRYHFCTTIVAGGYRHERFDVEFDEGSTRIRSVRLRRSREHSAGASGTMLSHEFHRIPVAQDGTVTFLVKSRPVTSYSMSYDPRAGRDHRHVALDLRLRELDKRI